jgi:hypothetical protein
LAAKIAPVLLQNPGTQTWLRPYYPSTHLEENALGFLVQIETGASSESIGPWQLKED